MTDIELMKQALIDSGLIGRYSMYADHVPTMQHQPLEEIAADWAPLVVKAYLDAYEQMPLYMACGCMSGRHDNTISALRKAHPDLRSMADIHDLAFAHEDTPR